MKPISLLNRISVLATMVSLMVQASNVPPEIRNLKVQQRPGTYLVDVTFDLVDPDSLNGVFLSLEASSDNGVNFNLPAKTLSGDTGLIKPGSGKKMVWDAFTDWPDKYTPNAKVRVVANDSLPQGPTQGPDGFVWIPPGKFMMGSPADEQGRMIDEIQHKVYFGQGFWICDHEVTQAEYIMVMKSNPSLNKGEGLLPVDSVDWQRAFDYCEALNLLERGQGKLISGYAYRLPTEAEWEYTCRAGTIEAYSGDIDYIAWYDKTALNNKTRPVKLKRPNAWGIYDMHGNVREWTSDWYGSYPVIESANPKGHTSGPFKVQRGGGWHSEWMNSMESVEKCRSAARAPYGLDPNYYNKGCGIRVVLARE
jgi:formylglycine-generating enzyme required for sulfatase activity